MSWKKFLVLFSLLFLFATEKSFAQERPRIVGNQQNQPFNQVEQEPAPRQTKTFPASPNVSQPRRTVYETPIVVSNPPKNESSQVVWKKANDFKTSAVYSGNINQKLSQAIDNRVGLRYVYGSDGPNTYDCSGLVWSVFQDAGISFTRTSALSYWQTFLPVTDAEKYKFGTLVFFNRLGHVGIVADENGFYHASSSKGVTYSPFAGYWEKRIVGFRRIPMTSN